MFYKFLSNIKQVSLETKMFLCFVGSFCMDAWWMNYGCSPSQYIIIDEWKRNTPFSFLEETRSKVKQFYWMRINNWKENMINCVFQHERKIQKVHSIVISIYVLYCTRQKMTMLQLAGNLNQNSTSERLLYDHSKINTYEWSKVLKEKTKRQKK